MERGHHKRHLMNVQVATQEMEGGVALSNGDYGFGAFGSISCMLIGHLHDDAI